MSDSESCDYEWEDMTDVLMDLNEKVDLLLSLVKKLCKDKVEKTVVALKAEEISFVGDSDSE
jgi:hypothetical protein